MSGRRLEAVDYSWRNGIISAVRRITRRLDGAHLATKHFMIKQLQFRSDDVFLDLGGGSGLWSEEFGARVGRMLFVDGEVGGYGSLLAVAERMRLRSPDVVVKGDVHAVPLVSGSIDKLVCTEVIEHVGDPARVVHEVSRLLRPGGRAILTTTPDPLYIDTYGWPVQHLARRFLPDVFRRRTYLQAGFDAYQREIGHINRLAAEELNCLCRDAGLTIIGEESLHKSAGMWFEELRWGVPVLATVLLPATLPVYAYERTLSRRGLSPHAAVMKS
jgi:ubiquinone/menaquinone biosynthesis C-methylase UbiE